MLWYRIVLHFLLAIKSHIQLAQSSGQAGTLKRLIYVLLGLFLGLIMCSKKKILALESRDLSQAEKEITACKAEQIHKMTAIFTQNGPWLSF